MLTPHQIGSCKYTPKIHIKVTQSKMAAKPSHQSIKMAAQNKSSIK